MLNENTKLKITGKLEEMLNEAQKKSFVRKVTLEKALSEINDIYEILHDKKGITKKALTGTKVIINPNAQKFAKCYRGIPECTYISISFTASSVHIEKAYRGYCGDKHYKIMLSDEAKQSMIDYLENGNV